MVKMLLSCAALVAAAAAMPAAAQPRLPGGTAPPGRGTPVDAYPTPWSNGGSCVRMCPTDQTPCDPDYFKVADRRCNLNQYGPGNVGGPGLLGGLFGHD